MYRFSVILSGIFVSLSLLTPTTDACAQQLELFGDVSIEYFTDIGWVPDPDFVDGIALRCELSEDCHISGGYYDYDDPFDDNHDDDGYFIGIFWSF